jgi:hypothetical protein
LATTFIDLVNRLLRRLNEVEIEQSDFASARGVQAMAQDAINASIEQITQAEFTWPFNAVSTTQTLTAGQEHYDWPANFKVPNWNSFHIVKDDVLGVAGHPITYIDRDIWLKKRKSLDDSAGSDGISVPLWVFEKHGTGFGVSPSPDKAYVVSYEYWRHNTALSAHSDTSTIPSNFDEVIIQGALYHFYMFRDNSEQALIAEKRFEKQLSDMRTLLINKDDRVYGSLLPSRKSRGAYSIPVEGWW